MMALVKAGEQIQHLLLPQTDQKKSLLLSISQCQDYAWPHNLWPHTRVLSAMQHQGVTAVEGQCVCAHTNASILAGHGQRCLLCTARRAGNNHFFWEHQLHRSRKDGGGSHLVLF